MTALNRRMTDELFDLAVSLHEDDARCLALTGTDGGLPRGPALVRRGPGAGVRGAIASTRRVEEPPRRAW
ncbi:hypothetical protein ACFQPA_21515 [Halomarina halobia]|uniref:XdhC- CoxI domain-containing protein n=1 Tax=Halomarina halobia TaxID=3033386 RepID=A0ABD6AF65_9EURY|nr:hypothetical protein [Halomarina sp. PSR21]